MSRTESYEDIIADENETLGVEQPVKQPKYYKLSWADLKNMVQQFVEEYEDWEVNAYGSGKVVYATRLPNWEALGRKYYDIYLKAKKFTK